MTISTTSQLPPALAQPIDVLMIDNFDSFTWNLYQQLSLLGAEVTVIRNDAISPEVFPLLSINFLIVSPGPGHPRTDSGISKAAIKYFQGKVPILGVCMGLECMVDLYGGEIGYAGEIMHGKTSKLKHDNRGCFKGVPQGIESTRYHSLSAAHTTLPDDLAITSITEDSGVIMGVRHRKYTIEAVQYHPESILSQGGDDLIRNFLSLRGGLWQTNPESGVLDSTLPPFDIDSLPKQDASHQDKTKIPSILDKIYAQRLQDVALARSTHGTTFADLQTLLTLNIPPAPIQVLPRVTQTPPGRPALFAEIKRASPSKGPISVTTSPAAQALTYALAGAHLISVLTEPKWFLGSLHDMLQARMSVDHLSNRPVILRKDFILSRYQVLESRIWGADTILLIASMLPEVLLRDLYAYSVSLGMEPLVEVNNAQEMELALSIPAKIIGVNNRNLHDFNVDMRTTSRLSGMVKGRSDVVLCALSGISGAFDVDTYAKQGVHAVLVGESLMRAADPALFIQELLSLPASPKPRVTGTVPLVKICGIRSEEEAIAIAEAGADMLGLMFVEKSKRYVTLDTAREISQAVRSMRYSHPPDPLAPSDKTQNVCTPWLTYHANQLSSSASPFPPKNTRTGPATRPLLVGVFQDAPLAHVLYAVAHAQLDMVQLHGNEPTEWANRIPVPVIRVFHVAPAGQGVGKVMNTRNGRHNEKDDDGTLANGTGSNTELNSGSMTKAAAGSLTGALRDANSLVPGITLGGAHHFVLLDSMRDDGSGKSGGSGRIVDWELARQVVELGEVGVQVGGTQDPQSRYPLPIILAGGLTPENVAEAVIQVGPWAVDVSGGVETPDGRGKDLEKVRSFVRNAKGAVSQMATPKGVRGEQA